MQLKNTKESWGAVAQSLHWVIFILFVGQLAVGLIMSDMDPSDQKWFFYRTHKAMGIVILGFVFARILWRMKSLIPNDPKVPTWQLKAAETVVLFLYFMMLALPISGLMMSLLGGHNVSFFGLFTIEAFGKIPSISGVAHEAHSYLGYAVIAAIAVHIGAALYHHFVIKDDVLTRMLPGKK